jgi:hypothetical protein
MVVPGQYLKIETTARYSGSAVTADGTQVSWPQPHFLREGEHHDPISRLH